MVAEGARQRVVGDDAEADLVGDEHRRPLEARQRVEQLGHCRLDIAPGHEQVREPQCQAVDQHRPLRPGLLTERGGEVERRLARRPALAAAGAVVADALPHLVVERLGGGEVERLGRGLFDQRLGVAALARARAAQHQRQWRQEDGDGPWRGFETIRQDAPPPEDGRKTKVQRGGLLARGRRSRHLPGGTWPPVASSSRSRRLQLRGQRRHRTGLPCLVAARR
jgi:hypothetical protein